MQLHTSPTGREVLSSPLFARKTASTVHLSTGRAVDVWVPAATEALATTTKREEELLRWLTPPLAHASSC
jgi:hypothetical protein